ncbi:decaheme c-type cytochrome, DmsE family [Roseibium alexandrii]|uniref:Decaheme c-type cytochrome, DmsE family n=2 Tax=Roseibium alexandrii TaxID=388408 RepID=A0A0M7ASV4_9HYPH|nr:decaheme c-type cytochrome, DmsE family [Roseibium alexandrii]
MLEFREITGDFLRLVCFEIVEESNTVTFASCDHHRRLPRPANLEAFMKFIPILATTLVSLFWPLAPLTAQTPAHPEYAGSQTCVGCHEAAAESWATSHHAKAWMEPSETTVDGDFGGVEFAHRGRTTRFFQKDGEYFIETTDFPDGPTTLKVVGVGGIHPLQQYLIETKPGRLQSLDIAWDQDLKIWYHIYEDQELKPEDGFHWSGPYKNWNARCAECHATGFEKNYDPRERRYSSMQAEIGVGCEACHGPGEAHVTWAEHQGGASKSPFPGLGPTGLMVAFSENNAETEIQQCAGCHSRREAFEDGNPLPGTPFHDAYRLALLRNRLYHADGQILDEVYVYGSFLQSKMYDKGVRCSNCHEPHSGALRAQGNAICTQCHSEAGNTRFPSLTLKVYDDPSHHFHETDTAGAQCVSCHMIERTYMGIDERRDHSFRVPRPDLSATIGTPNACNDCHTEKTPDWAATELQTRFPDSPHRGPHFGEVFHAARNGASGIGPDLLQIAHHAAFPAIVRASALDLLSTSDGSDLSGKTDTLLEDDSPIVRAAALKLLQRLPPQARLVPVLKALDDPSKAVRIEAARQLLGLQTARLPENSLASARSASKEWQASLANKTDFPETHMVIGGTSLAMRNWPAAIAAFTEVTRLDPQLVQAWVFLVRLNLALQNPAAAELALQKALLANPEAQELRALRENSILQ